MPLRRGRRRARLVRLLARRHDELDATSTSWCARHQIQAASSTRRQPTDRSDPRPPDHQSSKGRRRLSEVSGPGAGRSRATARTRVARGDAALSATRSWPATAATGASKARRRRPSKTTSTAPSSRTSRRASVSLLLTLILPLGTWLLWSRSSMPSLSSPTLVGDEPALGKSRPASLAFAGWHANSLHRRHLPRRCGRGGARPRQLGRRSPLAARLCHTHFPGRQLDRSLGKGRAR